MSDLPWLPLAGGALAGLAVALLIVLFVQLRRRGRLPVLEAEVHGLVAVVPHPHQHHPGHHDEQAEDADDVGLGLA